MLLDLVRQYRDLIQAVEVERFRVVGTSYELKAVLLLRDGSQCKQSSEPRVRGM
jgi:hypothetical protein